MLMTGAIMFVQDVFMENAKNLKVAENPLELIHVDLCEINISSLGGAEYFLLF